MVTYIEPVALGDLPPKAAKLANVAVAAGWVAWFTQSADHAGRTTIAIRMRRNDVAAWALWVDGKFSGAATSKPLERLNYGQILAAVTA